MILEKKVLTNISPNLKSEKHNFCKSCDLKNEQKKLVYMIKVIFEVENYNIITLRFVLSGSSDITGQYFLML